MSPILSLMAYIQTRIARSEEDGIVAAEYVMLGVAILIIVAVGAAAFGTRVNGKWASFVP